MPHNKNRFDYGLFYRHLEMALHAVVRTGSIFEACDDLLQAGDAYSADEKKHRARSVVRIVLAYFPQLLVFASFLRMLFLTPVFCFGLSNVVFDARERSRVTPR